MAPHLRTLLTGMPLECLCCRSEARGRHLRESLKQCQTSMNLYICGNSKNPVRMCATSRPCHAPERLLKMKRSDCMRTLPTSHCERDGSLLEELLVGQQQVHSTGSCSSRSRLQVRTLPKPHLAAARLSRASASELAPTSPVASQPWSASDVPQAEIPSPMLRNLEAGQAVPAWIQDAWTRAKSVNCQVKLPFGSYSRHRRAKTLQ